MMPASLPSRDVMVSILLMLCGPVWPLMGTMDAVTSRTWGRVAMSIQAGPLRHSRAWQPQPLPSGVLARLLMARIFTDPANRKGDRAHLGVSPLACLRSLRQVDEKLSDDQALADGAAMSLVDDLLVQLQALGASVVNVSWSDSRARHHMGLTLFRRTECNGSALNDPRGQWPIEVSLGPTVSAMLEAANLPMRLESMIYVSDSLLAMDLYLWMTGRALIDLEGGVIPWTVLAEELGSYGFSLQAFKKRVRHETLRVSSLIEGAAFYCQPAGLLMVPGEVRRIHA